VEFQAPAGGGGIVVLRDSSSSSSSVARDIAVLQTATAALTGSQSTQVLFFKNIPVAIGASTRRRSSSSSSSGGGDCNTATVRTKRGQVIRKSIRRSESKQVSQGVQLLLLLLLLL